VTVRRWLLTAVLVAAGALLIARGAAQVYTDYLWYAALGAADVWRAKYSSLLMLRLGCAVAATAFVFANLYAVRQSVVSLVLPRRLGNLDIGEEVPREQLTYTAALVSLALGIALAWSRGDWSAMLAARTGRPFGESDPYFAKDLAFFVHRLPLETSLFEWSVLVVLISIGAVVLLYALTPSLRWEQGGLYVSAYVRRHLAMLAGALLLILSWHYRLRMFAVLGAGEGLEGAFGYFDHRVAIPASIVMSLVTLGAGLTVLWAGWTGQMRLAFAALTGVLLSVLAARQVAPFVARRAVASRDPAARERPYEATRAGYTRRAFAVERIVTGDASLTFASLAQAAPYVPLWDDGALRRSTERALAGATAAWQPLDSAVLAAVAQADAQQGGAVFIAGAVEDNGQPVRVPASPGSEAPPVIVVADSLTRPMIVADTAARMAAPSLDGPFARLAYALAMQDLRVWLGPNATASPRMLDRRSVRERVAALAPFLAQGSHVTPLWIADTLAWTLDMYASSATYPLSRRIMVAGAERSYFQHAATAIVNSASGRVVFVADSQPDPVAATWIARFPRLFVRPTALRAGVAAQLPPARDGARAQAAAFGRYGARGETDVVRHLPDDEGPDSALADSPAPLLALPRAGAAAWVLPLLDRTERVRGLVVALGGASHRVAWLPTTAEPAPVWSETLDRLRAADTVSTPSLVRGYVRPVPVGNRIILVQPRYDWRSPTPRLLYVSAAFGDTIRTARSVFQLGGRPASTVPLSESEFRVRVRELYEEMRRASTRGDWGTYGRAFDALGALVRQSQRRGSR